MFQTQVSWPNYSSAVSPTVYPSGGETAALVPRLDLLEGEQELLCVFELPGARLEDLEVEVEGSLLEVRGRTLEGVPQGPNYIFRYQERPKGRFARQVLLPQPVDGTKVTAHYQQGLLLVHLPRTGQEGATGYKVRVQM